MGNSPAYEPRGITTIAIAIVILVLLVVAAGGYLFFATPGTADTSSGVGSSQMTGCTTAIPVSSGSMTTNGGLLCGSTVGGVPDGQVGSSSSGSSTSLTASSSISTSTLSESTPSLTQSSTSSLTLSSNPSESSSSVSSRPHSSTTSTRSSGIFTVTFIWVQNSTAAGSTTEIVGEGSFTIDVSTGTGTTTGNGIISYSITGGCKGSESLNYTFPVVGGVDTEFHNLTLAFEPPTPETSNVSINCLGTQSTVTYSWLSVIPELVSLEAAHGSYIKGDLDGGAVSYAISIE